jgi:hypothetical protein
MVVVTWVIKYSRISSNDPSRDKSLAMSMRFTLAPDLGAGVRDVFFDFVLAAGAFIIFFSDLSSVSLQQK